MVRVPTYEQSVTLRPEFRQDLTSSASPQAFGSDIGQGMEGLAKGGMGLAAGIAKVRDLEDTMRAKDADNAFADWLRERQFGQGGYMTLEGRAAVDGRSAFDKEVAERRREFGQGLSPGASYHFENASRARMEGAFDQSVRHAGQGLKTWFNQASTARVETFANDALVNFSKPDLVAKNIAAGQAEIRQSAAAHGWDAETLKSKDRDFVSGVHKNITLRIAQTDPVAADKYMKENSKSLSGADMYSLETSLKSEIQSEQSKRHADDILQNGRKVDAPPAATRTMGQTGPSTARAFLSSRLTAGKVADHIDGLDQNFATNIGAMIQDAPPGIREKLGILSGYRSEDRQQQLWNDALKKYGSPEAARKWVAPPGSSKHNHGQAVDLAYDGQSLANAPKEVVDWVHANASNYGLYFPMKHEPWHVEPVGSRTGTVSPRSNGVAPRAAMASYDDIESRLAAIPDARVRDLTRQRVMAGIEMQNKASAANEAAAKAQLWQYIDQGATPDQVPADIRRAAGMAAVSAAWSYMGTVKTGREVQTDETLAYDIRRYAAQNPAEFAKVDLNDYRDRLSKDTLKELTALQTGALTDQRKAREAGLELTSAFSQATTQLKSVGITTDGKKGTELERANMRIAQFNNALSSQMDEFKRANDNRAPNQMEIQSMINRLLLPVVIKQPGTLWDSTWAPPGSSGGLLGAPKTFAFDAQMRPDGSVVSGNFKISDIPIDLRRGIAGDLERNLGRKPSEAEILRRYEDVTLQRPTFNNFGP